MSATSATASSAPPVAATASVSTVWPREASARGDVARGVHHVGARGELGIVGGGKVAVVEDEDAQPSRMTHPMASRRQTRRTERTGGYSTDEECKSNG